MPAKTRYELGATPQFARYNVQWDFLTHWAFSGTEIPYLGKYPVPLLNG